MAARQCVVCGTTADAFCAGCGITPYCSERCQRRDWPDRHMAVCHNLARMNNENVRATRDIPEANRPNDPEPRPAMPLRRPHATAPNRKQPERDDDIPSTSRAGIKPSGPSSGVKGDRLNQPPAKLRQPFKPKNTNQENDEASNSVQETPKDEQPANKPRTLFQKKFQQRQHEQPKREEVNKPLLVPKVPTPEPIKPDPPVSSPVAKEPVHPVVKPASVSDVTPTKKFIPKNYLVEKLSIGDVFIVSVDNKASACRVSRGDYVCLAMAERFEGDYQALCEDFAADCDKDLLPYKLVPGETCSYFNPEDGGWYRARCLNPTTLALLDSGKIITVTPTDKCRKLPSKYEAIPEFCAVLTSKNVEVGCNLKCEILSRTSEGYKISIWNFDTNADVGEGEVTRWLPTVEYPTAPAVSTIPEIKRPPLTDNSKVLLVVASSLDRVFVRPSDATSQMKYNEVLQQVLLTAMKEKPLTEPPQKGQVVIAKFTDGNHYRALVHRTNVKQNKYMVEYVEYGNIGVSKLEDLFPCPPEVDLQSMPAQVSMVKLGAPTELSPAAEEYLETIKEDKELILTLPDGRKFAPSGSEATLTLPSKKENLAKKLTEMCTPEWKKIENRGGDVVDTEPIMFDNVEYTVLPKSGCTIQVLDTSVLQGGVVSGHDIADKRAHAVFNHLTAKMEEYCNSALGKEPYLPKPEELCIAKLPPYPQWFRGVLVELAGGAGSRAASVCYLDYGNLGAVPVALVRKMMPEFVAGYPVMGLHIEIRDFPPNPTEEQLTKALLHMKIDDEGRGTLRVTKCIKQSEGMYIVDAPELIKAMAE